MDEIRKEVLKYLADYGFAIIGALIILAVGVIAARWLGRVFGDWLEKKVEPPIKVLAVRVVRLIVFALAVVLALDKLHVPIAPMVAGIGVAGVGIGLATQGVLSNVVAGLTIIFTKPFRVGQYIELLGVEGQVQAIELFTTTLLHADQSRVVIPNRKIVGEVLHNYGTIRQLNISVGVSYDSDINQVLAAINEVLGKNPRLLKEPAPAVGVTALGDSSVNIAIKPWASVADFGAASGEITQEILRAFREKKIEMPFPQHEVRLLNGRSESNEPSISASVGVTIEGRRL